MTEVSATKEGTLGQGTLALTRRCDKEPCLSLLGPRSSLESHMGEAMSSTQRRVKRRRESKAASGLVCLIPQGFKYPGRGHTYIIKGLFFRPDVTSFWPGAVRYTLICIED